MTSNKRDDKKRAELNDIKHRIINQFQAAGYTPADCIDVSFNVLVTCFHLCGMEPDEVLACLDVMKVAYSDQVAQAWAQEGGGDGNKED